MRESASRSIEVAGFVNESLEPQLCTNSATACCLPRQLLTGEFQKGISLFSDDLYEYEVTCSQRIDVNAHERDGVNSIGNDWLSAYL